MSYYDHYTSYTVVANFSTYWVKLSSEAIQVGGALPGANLTCLRESYSLYLIKTHGLLIISY